MTKLPVAYRVERADMGAFCADRYCGQPVYLDRIESGPRIGVRVTWRHVSRYPGCATDRDGRRPDR